MQSSEAISRGKILVIEDSHFLRVAIERFLTKAGFTVTGAADGAEGVDIARSKLPGLILLDMMLPGLDGISVLKALKQDASTAGIPVIVLTGLSQRNETKLKQAGAAAYLEKSQLHLETGAEGLMEVVNSTLDSCAAETGLPKVQPRNCSDKPARLRETVR
jgi:CheY-like chemotaxis protein